MKRYLSHIAVVASLTLLASVCQAASNRVHADYESQAKKIKTIGLLDPDVGIYELSAGGIGEKIDEWSAQGKANITEAVKEELAKKGLQVKIIEQGAGPLESVDEINSLYGAIIYSINMHTRSGTPDFFPLKAERFEYSVGPLDEIFDAAGVDAVLLVHAYDEVSSGGRKATAAVGALFGVIYRPGRSFVGMALAESNGTLLWYEDNTGRGGRDLRSAESVGNAVANILDILPEAKP